MQSVFLVEDSPLLVERLKDFIAALPDTRLVGQATGAREAIAGILAAKPDVVLLDLSLAQGTGFDVLSAVHPREPGIEFYLLSNFASEPYRRYAERLGAKDFFDKAHEFERLRGALKGETTPCLP